MTLINITTLTEVDPDLDDSTPVWVVDEWGRFVKCTKVDGQYLPVAEDEVA